VNTTATPNTTPATPDPTRWVHTGIEAPHTFRVQDFTMLETHRGVAYSATLVHPDLGVVGLIDNEGCGGPTSFATYDRARYSQRDLEAFLTGCRQDGEPMDTGPMGLETLLDEIINEAEFAEDVDRMRREGQFLVRFFQPRTATNYGSHRGPALPFSVPALRRDARAGLVTRLAGMPAHQLTDGASWQMFDGAEWVPLLGEPLLTIEQTITRLQAVTDLLTGPEAHTGYLLGVPLDDEFFLFGAPTTGRFTLIGDTTKTLETAAWCQCARRPATVRFQRWDSGGLLESGTVHAVKRCRRLVRID
jgi:hypothetical protein